MNKQVINAKLESLRRCIERVQQKTPPNIQALKDNVDAQDIIVLNLSRAVQITIDIASHIISETNTPAPTTMRKTFDTLTALNIIDEAVAARMKNAVGFRNIAVHCYDDLNLDIVFAIATQRLQDFKAFAQQLTEI